MNNKNKTSILTTHRFCEEGLKLENKGKAAGNEI
jgi:hypothetical protein